MTNYNQQEISVGKLSRSEQAGLPDAATARIEVVAGCVPWTMNSLMRQLPNLSQPVPPSEEGLRHITDIPVEDEAVMEQNAIDGAMQDQAARQPEEPMAAAEDPAVTVALARVYQLHDEHDQAEQSNV